MSKFNTFIIVLIIAIILFVLLNFQDKNIGVNNISFQETVVASNLNEDNKARKTEVDEPQELPLELPIEQQPITTDNKLSYLNIYKKYKLAIDCNGMNLDKLSEFGKDFYIDEFDNEIKFRSNKRQIDATDAQLQSYQDFVEECWDLYLEMPDISDLTLQKIKQDPYTTRDTLKVLLQSTEAYTPEEIELEEVLIAGFDFLNVDKIISELSRGTHTLSE